MVVREQDKHFLWSLLAAIGVILVWKGLWEGLYEIPYLGDPWVALFIGFATLTFSGIIFKEFDPLGSLDKSVNKIAHYVQGHPKKHLFEIGYYDKVKKKNVLVRAEKIKHIEKGSLIVEHENKNQEVFIPLHRIREVLYQNKPYWRL
ncbi:DUF504 domain-containing protein [Candidatus Woesearchaeota archaeon]|nr:DUF504 domain-containing protein [Candidatus Woesearchaeota archaeon]